MADKNNFAEELYKNTDKRAFDKAKFKNEILSENKRNASNRQVGNDDADKDGGLFEKAKDVANVVSYINPLTASARLAYDVTTHPEEVKDWTKAAAGVVGDAVSSMFSDKDSYTGIKDSELPNHISKRSKSFRTLSDEEKSEHLKQKFYLLSGKKDKPGEGMAQTDYLKSIANSKPISGEDILTGNGQTVNTNLYGYTQDEIDYANKVIKDQKDNIAETKKQLKELSEFTGKKIKDSEDRKSTNWVAKKLYEDAKDMADAPFKGDLDDTNAIANYGRGVKSGARAENIPFAGAVYSKRVEDETQEALKAFNKAQENWAKSHKQGDEMTAEDVKKAIGEDKFEIVSAAYTLAEVSKMRENNLSLAYQSGQSLAQSLSMMAEMLIARKALGRVFGKVGKMDKVLDKKMARNWKNGNYGSAAGNFMQQRFINAPSSAVATVPMAVKNIEQAETERAMNGEEMTTKDYISATADAAIETFTETGGGKLLDIGNDALKKQAGKAFKSTLGKTKAWKFAENMGGKLPKDFKRYVNFVKNTDIANEVLQSPISEYQEEFLGAGLGLAKGTLLGGEYYEDAKDEMAYMLSREGNVVTAGSVLPMTLLPSFIGGGLKMAAAKRSAKAVGKYGKILTDQIDKMDISDNEKADRKKKLADYITSRKGNLDDNEAEYIAGQMGLDVQSISTLKKYANSVKSYYETGDIDTLTKDMSAEDKQVVGSMLTAWWKVRFDGANERYNNYVAAKEKLKQATSERNELVKKLGGTNLAMARTQELFEKYKDNTISEEEDAELRTLMNIDVQEAEDEYKSAYESMRNPGVRSNSKSDVKAQQGQNPVMQPTTDGTKRTSVSYSRRLPNGTIQRGTIYDENGFTDEEVKTGRIKATEHPDAALQTEDGRYDILDMGVDDLIIEPTAEEKDREEARAIAEETRRQEQMEADEISGLESAIQSGEKTQKQDAMSYLKNKYDGEDFLEEGENLSDVVDFLRDATDGRSFEEKMNEVMDSIKPKFRNLFSGMVQSISEGNADISEDDVISLFDDTIEEEGQPVEESGVIENAKQRLLGNISTLPKNVAIDTLREKVKEVRTTMAKASYAMSNIQSQIDSENVDENAKPGLEEAKSKHNELLRKAQSDYEVLMSAIEEYDTDLFNELSSQESQSESETAANNSVARRSEEKRKDEANPERKGKTSVVKTVLDKIEALRAQGMTDEQITDAAIKEYKDALNKARKLERKLARQEREIKNIFFVSDIDDAQGKIAETKKYLNERNATLSQMEEIIKGFGPEAEQKLADAKFTKKEQQKNKMQAMADEFKDKAEADLDKFIESVDNHIDECAIAIAEERRKIENKKVVSADEEIKSNRKISNYEESLRQWEYIRQQYAKDGKSRRDGALTVAEYYQAILNSEAAERAKKDEETQRAIANAKAEKEARKAENRRELEEKRAKEKAEKQNEQQATPENLAQEGSDNTNEEEDSEESGEVDRKGLMSDGEIEDYEDDMLKGQFAGKSHADTRYLKQARSKLEDDLFEIETLQKDIEGLEKKAENVEEDSDIAKAKEKLESLNEIKADTERYIASKEAQMKANGVAEVSEDQLARDGLYDKINTLDVDNNVKEALGKIVGWFYEYNYGHGRTHKNNIRHNVMNKMLVLQDILNGNAETEKEKVMKEFAAYMDDTNLIGKLPNDYENYDVSIEEELLGDYINSVAEFLENNNSEQKNDAIVKVLNEMGDTKILSFGEREEERLKAEKEEAAKNAERDRNGREAAKEAITSAKEYISQRKDGKARDERIEDEDGRVTTGLYMMDGRVMTGEAYKELSDEDKDRCKELFALTGKASNGAVMTILTDKNKGCKVHLDSKGKIWSLGEVKQSALSGFSTVREAIESDANEQKRKRLERHDFANENEYDAWLGDGAIDKRKQNITYRKNDINGSKIYDVDSSKAKKLRDGEGRLTNRQVLAFLNGELTYRDLIGDSAEGMKWLNDRSRTDKKLDDVISDLSEFSSVLNGLVGKEVPMDTISGIISYTVAAHNKNTGIKGESPIKAEVKKRQYNGNITNLEAWNGAVKEVKHSEYQIKSTTVYWISKTGEEEAPKNPYNEALALRSKVYNALKADGITIVTEEAMEKKLEKIMRGEGTSNTKKSKAEKTSGKRKAVKPDMLSALGEPSNARDFIMRELYKGRLHFVWDNGDSATKGLKQHLGAKGAKERQSMFWLLRSKEKGGMVPEVAAQRLMEEYNASNIGAEMDDMEMLGELLEVLSTYPTKKTLLDEITKMHKDALKDSENFGYTDEEIGELEREDFAKSQGFGSFAEYEEYEKAEMAALANITDEKYNELQEQYYDYYYGQETGREVPEGDEVLHREQSDTRQNEAQGDDEQQGNEGDAGSLSGGVSQAQGTGESEVTPDTIREKAEDEKIVKSLEDAYDNNTLNAEMVQDALGKLGVEKFSSMNIREEVGKKIAEIMMRNEITDSEMTDDEAEAKANEGVKKTGEEAGNGASELLKAGEAKSANEIVEEVKEREEEAKSEKVKDWFQDFLKTYKGAKFIMAKRILNAIVKTELTAGEYSELKAEVEQAVSTKNYTKLEDMVDEIKSSHASGGVKAHASGGMISRTARRYAKQVLRHLKKIAKASHGRLGVYALSELMDESGEPKTDFGRAVIEYARANGVTPAQAAKELMEQRGEAKAMFLGKKGAAALDNAEEATIRLDNLRVAKDMESAGKDAKTIKIATGWERGADGKWRYETESDEFFTEENTEKIFDLLEESAKNGRGARISDLLKLSPAGRALISAYPSIFGGSNRVRFYSIISPEEYRANKDAYDDANVIDLSGGRSASMGIEIVAGVNDVSREEANQNQNAVVDESESLDNTGYYDRTSNDKQRGDIAVDVVYVVSEMPSDAFAYNGELYLSEHSMGGLVYGFDNARSEAKKRDVIRRLNRIFSHEMQHLIQQEEGFAIGANESSFDNFDIVAKARESLKELEDAFNEVHSQIELLEDEKYKLEKEAADDEKLNQEISLIRLWIDSVYRKWFASSEFTSEADFNSVPTVSTSEAYEIANKLSNIDKRISELEKIGVSSAKIKKAKKNLDKIITDLYHRTAGEVESRNVERRLGMSAEERRNTLASETEDVAREDQIFLEENLGQTGDNVQLMEGTDGTVYGWCEIERDAEGNVVARHIYLNDEVLNANTMVHELGHLWLNLLSEINPKMYEHGLGLAKKHPLFAELKASDEYGMLSDDEIADEVLARMIGDSFDLLAEYTESKEDRDRTDINQLSDVIGRLKRFFKRMFGEIRSAFGEKWTDEEIEELRLSDFAKMALKDIISGKTVEEWAARTIGGETLDRVERIDRELNDKDLQIPPERISMAAAAANKLLVSNVGTNVSALTQFVKYWNNVLRMLFKGKIKKAYRAIAIENSDGDLPILMLYQAMNEYRRSIGEEEIDMHECPYYDWEGMEIAIRNKQTKATEDLVKGSLIPKTEAAITALSMLRDKDGKMIGKKKAAKLLDVYLMSHSAVERKSKGKNIRTGESTFESGVLGWINGIWGFGNVDGIESLVDAMLSAKESDENISQSIDELWDSIRSITSYYRTLMYEHGCISAELRNEWENDYYVPNKGVMGSDNIDLDETDEAMYMSWLQANETRRTDNSSRTLTTSSKGGKSIGTSCLDNLFKQMNTAISHVTVNDYRKILFYDLVENKEFGEASGLFKIEEGGKAKLHAKNSKEAARLRTVVVHDGELYTIVWGSDEEGADNRHGNLLIADAVNGNRLRIRDGFFSGIAKLTKVVQSLCYTTWRVGFFMGEFFRQYCTRSMSIFINEAEKGFIHIPLAVLKSLYDFVNLPSFAKRQTTLWVSAMLNSTTSQIQQKMPYFEEFQENAGNAGFTTSDMYEDYNALKNLARGLEESSRTGETKASMMKVMRASYRVLTAWQKAQDVTNRYIVYEKCRKEGMSARDAARMSRNVGPNFLKTGRGGYGACVPIQLGLFYNATIQGIKNMFKKYYSGDSFAGTNLTGEQKASRITAGAMMQASVLLMGYCLATGVFYGDGDDDDKWRQSLDRGDELFFNNTLHNFMTEGNGYWLSKFVSIPEEWRMLYSVGAFISQQQHGMITKSECARRMVRAVVEGAIPFNNTVKSFLYGATDYVYNKYNETGLNTQSMMANAVRNGVLDDISVIAEPSKILFSGEMKQTYDGGDRRDNNRLPSYLSKIVDPHKQVSGNVELFLMKQFGTDVALDVTPVAEGALQVFDGVYGLFASHDSPVAEELDKYAADAYSKMTFENIRKMRGMVKEVKDRANALDAIANEKWYLNDREETMYKILTGSSLEDKYGNSKKESNDYSYTTQDRIARKKKLEYYVDMDEALKQIQDPETFKKVMWDEYQDWLQEKNPKAKAGKKKEINTQRKIDDYTVAYASAMWKIEHDREVLGGEPGSFELALIAKFKAKELKDLAKAAGEQANKALIFKMNNKELGPTLRNKFKREEKNAALTAADNPEFEYIGEAALDVFAKRYDGFEVIMWEAARNRLIDEHMKMVKYRDSRKNRK